MRSPTAALAAVITLALATTPPRARAQSLAERVAAAHSDTVEFHFAARPGVCGDGQTFIALGDHMFMGNFSTNDADGSWRQRCVPGPVRVVLTMRGGQVHRLHTSVGEIPPSARTGSADLGAVSAHDAAAYLLSLAERSDAPVSEHAILPAVLADSAVVWQRLLRLARDTVTRSHSTRQTAAFWLGRFAAATLSGESLATLGDGGARSDDDEVRTAAVFALSQLRHHQGIPPLIQVARANPNARVRDRAVFWLSESGDPRALAFLEEVLRQGAQRRAR